MTIAELLPDAFDTAPLVMLPDALATVTDTPTDDVRQVGYVPSLAVLPHTASDSGPDLTGMYLHQISKAPLLLREEEHALVVRTGQGDGRARQLMIEHTYGWWYRLQSGISQRRALLRSLHRILAQAGRRYTACGIHHRRGGWGHVLVGAGAIQRLSERKAAIGFGSFAVRLHTLHTRLRSPATLRRAANWNSA